jgi:phospholipase C
MSTRRDFFRQAAFLSGGAGLTEMLAAAVQRASGIDPAPGSTYLDAEHIVVLMQENRSFDHSFGALRGVRGFNDPRAVTLPNQHPVWLQTNAAGRSYVPFRLNLRETKTTWLGSLPHSWRDQTDARNHGNHDGWLEAKPSGRKECAGMPLTLGYYNREDLPFYYALADAFTVCDQNFCSSLTGTTPNRLHLWTGTIREKPGAPANVRNSEVNYDANARWMTFPERLEDAGVSWRIYQNEVSLPTGFNGEEDDWLSNFTDNSLEWFEQYHVGFNESYLKYLETLPTKLPPEIAELDRKIAALPAGSPALARLQRERRSKAELLANAPAEKKKWGREAWEKLPTREKNLHQKAFTTNKADKGYRELTTLGYNDAGTPRTMQVPKGDPLYQFRQDVNGGKLPTISWLVPSSHFSDHPGSPWYGAWYLAEVMNILTRNPAVWKKTIFILTYDENDGYFDHVPPFVAPDPRNPETGKVSAGIDAATEYVTLEDDLKKQPAREARGGPIGLGYRVPMIVASPWSRGGYVNSQVFDHTSVLQLMEKFLSHRTGKPIRETNISAWRRAVCGDMTSAFQPFTAGQTQTLPYPPMKEFLEGIHKAQFKALPSGFQQCTADNYRQRMPRQEPGVRPAHALPYRLHVTGKLSGHALELRMAALGAAGAPFHAYTPGNFRGKPELRTRAYAVSAGARLTDTWALDGFANGRYDLRVHGPNGYYRELAGDAADPLLDVSCRYRAGDVQLVVMNLHRERTYTLEVKDNGYGTAVRPLTVKPGVESTLTLKLAQSSHWYDFTVAVEGYRRRFAGRVETGKPGTSDPLMG